MHRYAVIPTISKHAKIPPFFLRTCWQGVGARYEAASGRGGGGRRNTSSRLAGVIGVGCRSVPALLRRLDQHRCWVSGQSSVPFGVAPDKTQATIAYSAEAVSYRRGSRVTPVLQGHYCLCFSPTDLLRQLGQPCCMKRRRMHGVLPLLCSVCFRFYLRSVVLRRTCRVLPTVPPHCDVVLRVGKTAADFSGSSRQCRRGFCSACPDLQLLA